jgi:hypothetical protein
MQNRRQFLCTAIKAASGAGVTLLLTPIASLAGGGGCGSSSNNNTTPAPVATTNPTTPACDGAGATSTVVDAHTHTVCVPLADINTPPAAGQTYTTSSAATDVVPNHSHQIVLTQAMLMQLAAGQTITVTTNIAESHTHDFSLQKTAQAATTPTPTPAPTTGGPY